MASYFQVKVQFTVEDSKGKVKKQNVLYLVDSTAVSVDSTATTVDTTATK